MSNRTAKVCILNQQVLKEVQKDIQNSYYPSALGSPLSHPGNVQAEKPTADQWKVFCLYTLPITLTRLWGTNTNSENYAHLSNFLHLLKLASMHQMLAVRITAYQEHIYSYLSALLTLYDTRQILMPYQYLSLHFRSMLERFEPTHAWRCFAFKRYNYVLQQLSTNNKFGMFWCFAVEQ